MDPYLLTRIGDVTIQRVLPKSEQPNADIEPPLQMMPATNSQPEELDLSMKNQRHTEKGEDEGGGSGSVERKPDVNSSDASEEEDPEESELDEDEQDVPLSLVTTRRSKENNSNNTPSASKEETRVEDANNSLDNSENQKEVNDHDQRTPMDFELAKEETNEESNESDMNQGPSDNADNDEDISLSKLLQGVNQDDSFQAETGDETNDNIQDDDEEERMGDAEDDYEDEADEEDTGQDEEDQGELEERDAESKPEEDQYPEGGERRREMIVIKQEVFNEESEMPGEEDGSIKRKMETEEETPEDPSTKKSKKGSGESGSDSEGEDQSSKDQKSCEKKLMNLRKNIREVMDENELDEATLSAQREEMERLQRVQEQQRIIREVNRQINLNRQSNNVISLLQGGSGASLLKVDKSAPVTPTPKSTSPNTVLVKLSSGSGPPQVVNKKVLEILKSTRSAANAGTSSKATALANKLLNKPGSLTSSVSIAPVKPGLTITKLGKQGEDDKATVTKAGKTKQKGKDVVMISSSSSDEDDCIVISGGEEEEEEEEEEDPTNSGMHTNDTYNVPDDQGRVLINVGKPDNEPEVFLAPQIARIIKPHQIGGVRFLFDNVVESLDRYKSSPGFGCILAHSMGLGKTLQVVSFCDVFLRFTEGKTVLCIMPINTLQNWLAEFNMWLPVEPATSPFAAHGDVQPRTFPLFVLNDMQKSMVQRAKVVIQWAKEGGVLLIGYELYRQLSLHKPRKKPIVRKRKINPDDDIDDEKNKHLLEEMHTALVKPGPDLVICDEGHRIKNSHASISQALKQIRSKRRVVLTGYPLQNNLLEYWCMVDFVRPNYLGSKTEFSNMFERPIQNGQCVDSTPQDVRLMRYRAHVLHSLLKGFVQRRSHSVLTNALPQKEEYVILVRMTTFQRKLYDTFMNEVVRTKAVPNPLKAFAVCCKIWNHPDVLYHFLRRRQADAEAVDLDLEETAGALVPVTGIGNPAVNPVLPVKRARGRSPKGTSPKRERKVNPRKRGGTEPDSPVKNPMVAAVMPNTTNMSQNCDSSSLQSSPSLSQPPQSDVKPLPSFSHPQQTQFPNRPAFSQYPPNSNNPYSSQYPSSYPGFNQPPHNEFHNLPPYNQGFPNQQGYQNNQNMYSGFGGNYYPPQDPSFSGGNYWNNPYFNDSNNTSSFSNYNDSDPNSSGFYNQDMMGSDSFNTGHRGYNSGMSMNHPGMRGMNPMQSNRMINNPNQSMMGMNSNMSMNSMGMPMNNMNNNMNQSNYGVNSTGMNMMNQGPQNIGMNPQQGMGMNQMGPMGSYNPMSMNNQNMGSMNMPGLNQTNMTQMNQSNPMNSQTSSSASLHTLTNTPATHSSAESQQEAAIQNIANNLMMSSQQVENAASRPNPQNSQDMLGESSLTVLGSAQSLPNSSQNVMSGMQNQSNQMANMSSNNQNQVNPGNNPNVSGDGQNQLMAPSSQSSHSIGNMISNNQTPQSVSGQLGSNNMQNLGTFSNDSQNMQPQSMFGNQSNPNNQGNFPQNSQNLSNLQGQPSFHQPNSQNNANSLQSSMIRNQQPNQNMFGQQNNVSLMGGQQNMFGGTNQQMQNVMNPNQSPRMNLVSNQQNMMSGGSLTGFDQTGSQNMLNNQSAYSGNQSGLMGTSQNQGMISNQDMPSSRNLPASVSSQQIQNTGSRNQPDGQNMFGNQNVIGNLQNMLTNPNMMGSQSISQSKSDHPNPLDQSQPAHLGINQSRTTSSQQNIPGNPGALMNQQSGLNDPMANTNMVSNSQQNSSASNPSMNPLMDSQQNMFGMNTNQMNSNYINNQNMQGPGLGNNLMNNQSMMSGSQNMGMMNNSGGFGMYGNQDTMSGNSGVMGNQMNTNFSNNQMGMYNQPGMMNYPGMMMGNQMNNYGLMNQQNVNNPTTQNQPYSNNMMRNPSNMMGMRNPQPLGGMNPDVMSGNYPQNQNNFGMMSSNNSMQNSFNQPSNNPNPKVEPNTFSGSSDNSNSRFMSGGDFMSNSNQMNTLNQGNLSQSNFNNEFGNFGLNSEESKMWDDINSKSSVSGALADKVENMEQGTNIKSENDTSSQENKVKTEEDSSFNQFAKPKTEGEGGFEKKEGEIQKLEESKSTKEAPENETKEGSEETKPTTSTVVPGSKSTTREDATIPYDWAVELLKDYEAGQIEASAKFALFFCILEESMFLGDRVLVFSQSLFTLNLIEDFLQRNELPGRQERWARNWNYYRLDGSTSAMEREKLINEFNSNPNIHLFLVSTRAGSLGINLVGANRVVVLDASWNPCHDTQAVCRVYRYGQRKPCFVYRLVTDNCLEKKIYDRQVNKQGMADRVVDECNPDAHLSIKEVTNLCWDNEEEKTNTKDYSECKDRYIDVVMQKVVEKYSSFLSKEPFQHESLLVDRKDKKLSQAEKRLAKRSYEMEKQQVNTRPTYGYYPGNTSGMGRGNPMMKPMASVRPMQSDMNNQLIRDATSGRPRQWIPAEVWQKQGMSAQEMTLPLDVVIPTNSPERSSIVLKAGQKVMVLKSPKGIYMQLENGKIIAIRTAFKVGGKDKKGTIKTEGTASGIKKMIVQPTRQRAPASLLPLRNNSNISIIPRGGGLGPRGPNRSMVRLLGPRSKQPVATARPYNFGEGTSHPPVTVTVTKKRVPLGGASTSTSGAQVEIRREPKQVTVTPIPHPSLKKSETVSETPATSETVSTDETKPSADAATSDPASLEPAPSTAEPSGSREEVSSATEPQF